MWQRLTDTSPPPTRFLASWVNRRQLQPIVWRPDKQVGGFFYINFTYLQESKLCSVNLSNVFTTFCLSPLLLHKNQSSVCPSTLQRCFKLKWGLQQELKLRSNGVVLTASDNIAKVMGFRSSSRGCSLKLLPYIFRNDVKLGASVPGSIL